MANLVTIDPQLPLTAEQWAPESRARVWRSRPAELLENEADSKEIAAAITDELRGQIREAHGGLGRELLTAAADERFEDALTVALGRYLGLTAGSWTPEARAEWQNIAVDELMEYPLSMLLPAIKRATRSQPWPNKFVPAIVEELEPRLARLKDEMERLEKLMELAE